VEKLLAKRGVTVTYETIRQWCQKLGPGYARKLKKRQGRLRGYLAHQRRLYHHFKASAIISGVALTKTTMLLIFWCNASAIGGLQNAFSVLSSKAKCENPGGW
jgi:hypothetical protein